MRLGRKGEGRALTGWRRPLTLSRFQSLTLCGPQAVSHHEKEGYSAIAARPILTASSTVVATTSASTVPHATASNSAASPPGAAG